MKNISRAFYNHSNKEILALFIGEHNAVLCYYTQYPSNIQLKSKFWVPYSYLHQQTSCNVKINNLNNLVTKLLIMDTASISGFNRQVFAPWGEEETELPSTCQKERPRVRESKLISATIFDKLLLCSSFWWVSLWEVKWQTLLISVLPIKTVWSQLFIF